MSLFVCDHCKCIENTALSNTYWLSLRYDVDAMCTECVTGTWHDEFPKKEATTENIKHFGKENFVYSITSFERDPGPGESLFYTLMNNDRRKSRNGKPRSNNRKSNTPRKI